MTEIELTVDGMMCGMCEAHVKDAIRKLYPGAQNVRADHAKNIASFSLEQPLPEQILKHELKNALKETGYELTDLRTGTEKQKSEKSLLAKFFSKSK